MTIYDFLRLLTLNSFDSRTGGKPDEEPDVPKPRYGSLSHQWNTVHGLVNIYLLSSCTYYICFWISEIIISDFPFWKMRLILSFLVLQGWNLMNSHLIRGFQIEAGWKALEANKKSWALNLKTNQVKIKESSNIPKKNSWAFKTFVPRQIQKSLSQNVEKLKANAVPAEFERHFCDSDGESKMTKFTDELPECLKNYKPPRWSFKMMLNSFSLSTNQIAALRLLIF